MQRLITKIISLFNRKKTADLLVSFVLTKQAVVMLSLKKSTQQVLAFAMTEINEDTSYKSAVAKLISKYGLARAQVSLVIPASQYHLLSVDKPDVDEADLSSALKYSAKDDIPGDLSQFVIEYFDIPSQPFGQNKVNLVAGKKAFIKELIEPLHDNNIHIAQISIEELAYKSLFDLTEDAVILISHQDDEELLLQIIKQNQIYFYRRVRGYAKINHFSEDELSQGSTDNLSLEIQRSLDYFESQLRQVPVKRIYFCLNSENESVLIDKVGENFPIPVLPINNCLGELYVEGMNNKAYISAIAATKTLLINKDEVL